VKIKRKNDLNLRMLEVFGAAMRKLTTVGAAEELGISQPAVSNAIKGLEKQMGFALFERTSRGLIPSDEARQLYEDVDPLFMMMNSIEDQIRDVRAARKGRLRITTTPPLSQSIIPTALKRFLDERQDVQISYDVHSLDAVIRSVETGNADLGLVLGMENHPGCTVMPLFEGTMECVMRSDHPLSRLEKISPADIAGHNFIGIRLDRDTGLSAMIRSAFAKAGVPHDTHLEVGYCQTASVLTEAGLGLSIVDSFTSRYIKSDDVVCRPFEPEIKVIAAAVIREGKSPSRITEAFIDELKGVVRHEV
jgi:DNA-binding transcriptional LysR family regulator